MIGNVHASWLEVRDTTQLDDLCTMEADGLCLCLSHIAHESCNYAPHTSRATTPHTCHATTPHTPAQERDGHARNTQPSGQSQGACTQQPRVDLTKKSNNEDHCTRQNHIMHKEAEEQGTPRRRDRCSCQTRGTQTTSHLLAD